MTEKSPAQQSFVTKTDDDTEKFYDKWADIYDSDSKARDYKGWQYCLELAKKHLKLTDLILMVGAGTGEEAALMKKEGFNRMHGHDGSQGMLAKAREKDVFEEYIHEFLKPYTTSCFRSDHYDAMLCIGCFVPKGLDERHVDDLFRALKVGGHSIIGTREWFISPSDKFDYPYDLEKKLQSMEREGRIRLVERRRYEIYSENTPGVFWVHEKMK